MSLRDGAWRGERQPLSAPARPPISVVVVVYESGPTLANAWRRWAPRPSRDYRDSILVDNASSDRAAQAAAEADPDDPADRERREPRLRGGGEPGAPGAARGRWLVLLNPDAYAEPDWLERLLAAATANPDGQVLHLAPADGRGSEQARRAGRRHVVWPASPSAAATPTPTPGRCAEGWVFSGCGGAMMIDRALFLGMGGFDERLFCYCEDVDLGYRLRLTGEPTLLVPDAVVRHVGSASTGGRRSDFAVFHGTRNRFWVFVKDTPPVLFWLTLPLHLLATLTLFARHATRGEPRGAVRGLAAGIRNIDVALAARREVQPTRTVGSWAIARAMTWNPLDLLLRRAFIQAKRPTPPGGA